MLGPSMCIVTAVIGRQTENSSYMKLLRTASVGLSVFL